MKLKESDIDPSIIKGFKRIAKAVIPFHYENGYSKEENLLLYWITSRYTHSTTVIAYNTDEKIYEYENLKINIA